MRTILLMALALAGCGSDANGRGRRRPRRLRRRRRSVGGLRRRPRGARVTIRSRAAAAVASAAASAWRCIPARRPSTAAPACRTAASDVPPACACAPGCGASPSPAGCFRLRSARAGSILQLRRHHARLLGPLTLSRGASRPSGRARAPAPRRARPDQRADRARPARPRRNVGDSARRQRIDHVLGQRLLRPQRRIVEVDEDDVGALPDGEPPNRQPQHLAAPRACPWRSRSRRRSPGRRSRRTFCRSAQARISSNTLTREFEQPPSVPSATRTPRATRSTTSVMPSPRNMLEFGL